jgi:hypothetical protein
MAVIVNMKKVSLPLVIRLCLYLKEKDREGIWWEHLITRIYEGWLPHDPLCPALKRLFSEER